MRRDRGRDIEIQDTAHQCEATLETAIGGSDGTLVLQRYRSRSTIREWGLETLEKMRPLAELMETRYPGTLKSLQIQVERLRGERETLSQKLMRQLRCDSVEYSEKMLALSSEHREVHLQPLPAKINAQLEASCVESIHAQAKLEATPQVDFHRFLQDWA